MKSRMERYLDDSNDTARTEKNQDLYEDIYNGSVPSSTIAVMDNESEIDISKIKELIDNREGFNRVKKYQEILQTNVLEEENEEYDIYEDIDNKIYDINMILEDAKSKRGISEREKYRSLRNTQYNILSSLKLDEENTAENEEMVTDFFTEDDKSLKKLIKNDDEEIEKEENTEENTSADLFGELKGSENTILTEAIDPAKASTMTKSDEEESTFYTNHMNFTKEDFEGFQNLHTTIRKNNILMRVLITILTFILVAIIVVVTFTLL